MTRDTSAGSLDFETACKAMTIYQLVCENGTEFRGSGKTLPAPVAMQSMSLVTDILKVAVFVLNLDATTGKPGVGGKVDTRRIPSLFISAGALYAVEVAPLDDGDAGGNTVDVRALRDHVRYIESGVGPIEIDENLAVAICCAARDFLAQPAGAPGPDGAGE